MSGKRLFMMGGLLLALAVALTVVGIWVPDWKQVHTDQTYWQYNADQRWYLTGLLAFFLAVGSGVAGVVCEIRRNEWKSKHDDKYNHPYEPNKKGVCVNCILRNDRFLAGE